MNTTIDATGNVPTHLRLEKLKELISASVEKSGGEVVENLSEIFDSLDKIGKENEELLQMNEVLMTSSQILRKDGPLLLREMPDSSFNGHLAADPPAIVSEAGPVVSSMQTAHELRSFTERFKDGFVLADEKGAIIEWNIAQEQLTGLSLSEVQGRQFLEIYFQLAVFPHNRYKTRVYEEFRASFADFTHNRYKTRVYEEFRTSFAELVKTGKSPLLDRITEIEIQQPNGMRRNLQMSILIIPTTKGFLSGCIIRDVTEQRQTIAALEESSLQLGKQKQFISRILESIPSSLVVIDHSLRVVSVNHNFLEKTHREEQTTLGHRLEVVFPQALLSYTHLAQRIQEVFQTGRSIDGGKVAYRASGLSNRVYYFRLFPIYLSPRLSGGKASDAEHVENVMLLMDDVTERERLGEEVRRVERHLASVVECANDLVVSLDLQGNIVTWNRAAEVASGIMSEQATGCPLVSVCAPDQRLVMNDMLARLIHGGRDQHTEANLVTVSNKEVPIAWSCSLMRDDSGNVVGIVAVGRDLTELRRMEDVLAQSAAMTSLGVMAGGIAHELRNPLGIISANAQLLMENPRDAKLRAQGLNKIYTATRRASLIIENLLKFARPAGGWVKKEINLTPILDETLALLSNQIDSQNVVVSVTYQPNLPHLCGSHQMLQQVFANLILNACNAMPEGGSLTIAVKASSSRQVEIHFMDTGRGISPENLSKIFDPFFTTMPVGKGMGLGLPISHTIIQQHQGVIEVHSEVGKGSDFIVRLPSIL